MSRTMTKRPSNISSGVTRRGAPEAVATVVARFLMTMCAAIAAQATLVPSAVADARGASVQRYDTCGGVAPAPGEYCSWADLERNSVRTPSGNLSEQVNGSLGYSVTSPWGETYSYSYATHAHFLYKDWFLHEQHQRILSETTTSFSRCIIAAHYHQVDYDLNFIRVKVECTPIA